MSLSLRLNKRVTLQAPATGQDATGEPLTGWTDFATVWAEVADISGREFVAAGGTQNEAMTKITVRRRAGIVPSMRVLHGAVAYNVLAVLESGNDGLILMSKRLA